MAYEMEMTDQKQESILALQHLRDKLNTFSALYWTQSAHHITFDNFVWSPCSECKPCALLQNLIKGYSHPYLTVREKDIYITVSQVI
jgi:hypothetical protein